MLKDGKFTHQSISNNHSLFYKLDDGIGHRARIGLIALPDDQTIEHELRLILDRPGVACFVNRLPCAATITPDSLQTVDTVFISCTNLRALSIIGELESLLGKSVI